MVERRSPKPDVGGSSPPGRALVLIQSQFRSAKMNPNEIEQAKVSDRRSPDSGFNFIDFFKSTKTELDKIVWPSRQQLISESAAVILMVVVSAGLVYFVDTIFAWVSSRIFL